MQNLKNPHSVSDSAAPVNGYVNGKNDSSVGATRRVAPTSDSQKPAPVVIPDRPRSLKMQFRFMRTITFAWWLFGRVLFWYLLMQRIFGSGVVMKNHDRRMRKYAREYRNFAVSMGALHIKLGQFISTRIDILPEEIIAELASLQDEVPSSSFDKIRPILQRDLGALDKHFQWFTETPVAAASLGQVYRAQLKNGDRVVVKVQRPGIREICYTDLAALRVVGGYAMRLRFIARRANVPSLVEEFGRVLVQELSYEQEAHNAARFTEIFKDDMGVYIPKIYTELSTDEVITLEDVTSIKINDFAAIEAAGINRKVVATRLMDSYLKMVFEERFFHADAHPGNLFIYPLPVDDAKQDFGKNGRPFYLIFVDFGMTGTLTPTIANGMITTLTAVVTRDARKLVNGYQELGLLLPDADVERIIEASEATFNQVWGMNMTQLKNIDYKDVAELGSEFNDLIYAMPFYLPQDFIYLGRAMGILSGLATSLDPSFNPWDELQPYAQKLLTGSLNGSGPNPNLPDVNIFGFPLLQTLFSGNGAAALTEVGSALMGKTLPVRANNLLERMERGELRVQSSPDAAYKKLLVRLEAQSRRTTQAVMFGSLLITSTLFYMHGDGVIAAIGYVFSSVALWSLWSQGD
jgi:predicted unusual protein kinase regulating ubiquinone biosynthesis (AarF/ABC1/UbiB family)